MNCSNCGKLLETGAAFCGNCGQAVASQPPVPPEPVVPPLSMPLPPSPEAPLLANTPVSVAVSSPETLPTQISPIAKAWENQTATAPAAPQFAAGLPAPAVAGIPSYALPVAGQQSNATKATLSVVLGLLGIIGAFFIPLIGLALGIAGVVLGSLSRQSLKRGVSTAGLIVSIVAIIAGLGCWAYAAAHDPRLTHKILNAAAPNSAGSAQNLASVTTPCYSVAFGVKLNVENARGSCNMNAFDGDTLDNSTDAYKVFGNVAATLNTANFTDIAKRALESDVRQSLPSFVVKSERAGQFAGSPAYYVTSYNSSGVSVVEAAALHPTTNGDNFFVFVHAVSGTSVDLKTLESGWDWR